jgi:hypothetical protein
MKAPRTGPSDRLYGKVIEFSTKRGNVPPLGCPDPAAERARGASPQVTAPIRRQSARLERAF